MKDEKFWREGMDGKRFALCSFRRFWFFGAAGILGAAVSAGLYLLITVALAGPPEYQVFSQYRIYFDSEKYGEIQDYYNAYTWGEIMKTDEVLDYVMEALPEGITKEQVKASVSVGAMNDVKIMPLTITTQDPELSETIAEAYVYGLDRFGHSIEGLSGMDCWLLEDAQEVPRGTKAGNAALLGLILGAAAGFFAWLIWYCLDDSIYLEADFENRYGIPVLGVLTEKRDALLQKELETALAVRDNYAQLLAEGLTNLINLLQPAELVIGGGISGAAELFLPQVQERIARMVYSRASKVQTLLRPAKFGNDAGIVGAARLGDM